MKDNSCDNPWGDGLIDKDAIIADLRAELEAAEQHVKILRAKLEDQQKVYHRHLEQIKEQRGALVILPCSCSGKEK